MQRFRFDTQANVNRQPVRHGKTLESSPNITPRVSHVWYLVCLLEQSVRGFVVLFGSLDWYRPSVLCENYDKNINSLFLFARLLFLVAPMYSEYAIFEGYGGKSMSQQSGQFA